MLIMFNSTLQLNAKSLSFNVKIPMNCAYLTYNKVQKHTLINVKKEIFGYKVHV